MKMMNSDSRMCKKKLDCIPKAINDQSAAVCPIQTVLINDIKVEFDSDSTFEDLQENKGDVTTLASIKFEVDEDELTETKRSGLVAEEIKNEELKNDKIHTEIEQKYIKTEIVQETDEGNLLLTKFNSETVKLICKTEDDTFETDSRNTFDCIKSEEIDIKHEPLESICVAGLDQAADTRDKANGTFSFNDLPVRENVSKKQIYRCDQCKYKTGRKIKFKRHVQGHRNSSKKRSLLSKTKTYTCKTCGFETNRKADLKLHMQIHTDSSEIQSKDLFKTGMYKCDKCNYKAKWKYDLKRHEAVHTDSSQINEYNCTICRYATTSKNSFEEHTLKHLKSKEMALQWKLCDCIMGTNKASKLKYYILTHTKSHKAEIYTCDMCGYQTKQKQSLKKHALVHKNSSELNMYKCTECDFETKHKSNLKAHNVAKHLSQWEKGIDNAV